MFPGFYGSFHGSGPGDEANPCFAAPHCLADVHPAKAKTEERGQGAQCVPAVPIARLVRKCSGSSPASGMLLAFELCTWRSVRSEVSTTPRAGCRL